MVKFCSKIAWVFSAIKEMIKQILKGAANQFGREFGRAGANQILKGSNSYNITNNKGKYEGRIKSSDSSSIKIYKEITGQPGELSEEETAKLQALTSAHT